MKISIVRSLDPQAYCLLKVLKVDSNQFGSKFKENMFKRSTTETSKYSISSENLIEHTQSEKSLTYL